jgi:hypothetical protein
LPDDEAPAGVRVNLPPELIDAELLPGESRDELIELAVQRELDRRRRRRLNGPDDPS